MVLLLVQRRLGDEHGEVAVLDALFLEERVSEGGDRLPDIEGLRTQNVAARYIVVFNEFGLSDNLCVPHAKVSLLGELNTALIDIFAALRLSRLLLLLGLLAVASSASFTLALLLLLATLATSCGSRLGRNESREVHDLRLVLSELNHLHHILLSDGTGGSVHHRVIADILELFCKALVNNELNGLLSIILHAEKGKCTLSGAKFFVHCFLRASSQVARSAA